MIVFNKPCILENSIEYIKDVLKKGRLCGNGEYTQACHAFFCDKYNFKKCLLTTSGTDALEMAAILCDVKPGDEVIVPSYTFVSTALAFVRHGAKIVFADSCNDNPNMDANSIESLITERTKVIVPVHYAGVACDMDQIMSIAREYNLFVVEDAAQAVDAFYKNSPLGSIGHLGCFSFHETKNITAGEGGLLVVNDERFVKRAEIIWEKGTNRSEFYRGEVNKYGWVDTGSSFLQSELNAAMLYSQLQNLDIIQSRRLSIWKQYYNELNNDIVQRYFSLPNIPPSAIHNAHMFYMIAKTGKLREQIINYLKINGIQAPFHYLSLHKSAFAVNNELDGAQLPYSDMYTDCLLRLPLFYSLTDEEILYVVKTINDFCMNYGHEDSIF